MPDLSQLTDEELLALKKGGVKALSDDALLRVSGRASAPPGMAEQTMGDNALSRGLDTFSDATQGLGQTATAGYGDEIMAGMAAPFRAGYNALTGKGFDLGAAYDTELANQRNIIHGAEKRSPKAYAVGSVVGALAAPGSSAAAPATTLGMLGRGALQGGAQGAAYGFGTGEGGFKERAKGAALGGATGAAIGGLVGGVAGTVAKRAARKGATTAHDIGDLADERYDVMDNLPAYDPVEAQSIPGELKAAAAAKGISKGSHPRIYGIIKSIKSHIKQNGSIDPAMLDIYRRRLNGLRGDSTYSSAVDDVVGELDHMTSNQLGGEAGVEARARWRQKIQLGKVENAVRDAYATAGRGSQNVSQHLKVHINKLLRADEKAQLAGRPQQFTKEMHDQMQKVVDTGTIEHLLSWLGKASPDSGLGMLGHTLTAIASGGLSSAQLPIAAGAFAAKKAAGSWTQGNVDGLVRIINGDASPVVRERARVLLNALTKGSTVAAMRGMK